jgi:ABC-2 type transport system permease protein
MPGPPFIGSAETSILARKFRFIEFFVPGIIAMSVMTSSLTGAVSMNAELRQKGVIRKLSTLRIDTWLPTFILLEVFAFAGIEMILTRVAKEAESAMAAANAIMYPMMFLSGTFFPVEMMSGVLQKIARILPLYYADEGLRASMVFADTLIALRCSAVIGVFAAAVFVVGTMTTTWEEDK